MTTDPHDRARRLILAALAEGKEAEDARWLEEHRAACPACAGFTERMAEELRALRLGEVTVGPALLAMTQRRLRARAGELRSEGVSWPLVLSVVAGFLSALVTAWGSWRALGRLPWPVVLTAVVLLSLLPASLGAFAAAMVGPGAEKEVRR
jgi:predicted anti-sigma-YlaC factor YlaD